MQLALTLNSNQAYLSLPFQEITCDCVVITFVKQEYVWNHPWGLQNNTPYAELGMLICEPSVKRTANPKSYEDGLLIQRYAAMKNEYFDLKFIGCCRKTDPKQKWLFVLTREEQIPKKLLPMKKPISLNLDWFSNVLPCVLHSMIADYYGPIYFDTVKEWMERNNLFFQR